MPGDFDWRAETTIIHEQPETAVYSNPNGFVVIRQRKAWDEDDDPYVYIAPENVELLVRAILAEAGIESGPATRPLLPKPEPMTSTERSRLHRQRRRNGCNGVDEQDHVAPATNAMPTLVLEAAE